MSCCASSICELLLFNQLKYQIHARNEQRRKDKEKHIKSELSFQMFETTTGGIKLYTIYRKFSCKRASYDLRRKYSWRRSMWERLKGKIFVLCPKRFQWQQNLQFVLQHQFSPLPHVNIWGKLNRFPYLAELLIAFCHKIITPKPALIF